MSQYDEVVRLAKLGRKAEQRGKVLKGCLGALVRYLAFTIAMRAWLLMLAVGVVHHDVWPAVPTIGYWWSCLLCALLATFLPPAATAPKKNGGES